MSPFQKFLIFVGLREAPPVPVPLRTRVAPPVRYTTSATVQPIAPQHSPAREPWTRPAPRVLARPEPAHRPETPWPPIGVSTYPAWDPSDTKPADPATWTARSQEPFTGPASPSPAVAPEATAVRDSGWPTPGPCSGGYGGGGPASPTTDSGSAGSSQSDSGSSSSSSDCGGSSSTSGGE